MSKRVLSIIVALSLLLTFLSLVGCTKRKVYEGKEGSVTVEQKGEKSKVKVKTKEGTAEIETGAAKPKDWPEDMPVYQRAKITGSSSIKGEGNAVSLSLALESSDTVDDIKKFYESSLPDEGWTITQTSATATAGEEAAIFAVNKGSLNGVVTIAKSREKNKTEVVIQLFSQ